jgi:adenylate cyclase class 2
MLEIEVKYRVANLAAVESRLRARNATFVEDRNDADGYWNAPHRDFAQTDEALRVRQIGERNYVTYKGPRIDLETKTRLEIEVPLADGSASAEDMRRVFAALGFRPTAVVRKHRRVYSLPQGGFDIHTCLDSVVDVGDFAELEIVADESKLSLAKAEILTCARELDLTDSERRSYLELYLERTQPK